MLFENAGGRNELVAAYLNWLGRQEQAEGYLSKHLGKANKYELEL